VGTRSLPNAHAVYQKQAIHQAALDNCADYNIELTNCLTGVSGSWWDRASMCMKAKEQFQRCCRLNRVSVYPQKCDQRSTSVYQSSAL
jgi:hypothetical protein